MIEPTVLLSPVKSAVPAQGGVIEVMVHVQAAPSEARYSGDETAFAITSFLRKKSQEGRGKQKPANPQA